jgi:hypothetical protein
MQKYKSVDYNTTANQVKGCKVKYISKSVNLKCERINKNLVIIMIYRRKVTNTFVCSYHARHTKSTYNENLYSRSKVDFLKKLLDI